MFCLCFFLVGDCVRGEEPVIRGGVELRSSKLSTPSAEESAEHHHSSGKTSSNTAVSFIIIIIIIFVFKAPLLLCVCVCVCVCVRSILCLVSLSSRSTRAEQRSSCCPCCRRLLTSTGTRLFGFSQQRNGGCDSLKLFPVGQQCPAESCSISVMFSCVHTDCDVHHMKRCMASCGTLFV